MQLEEWLSHQQEDSRDFLRGCVEGHDLIISDEPLLIVETGGNNRIFLNRQLIHYTIGQFSSDVMEFRFGMYRKEILIRETALALNTMREARVPRGGYFKIAEGRFDASNGVVFHVYMS